MRLVWVGDFAERHLAFHHRPRPRSAHGIIRRQRAILRQRGDGVCVHAKKRQPIAFGGHRGLSGFERADRFAQRLSLLRLRGLETGSSGGRLGRCGSDVARLLRLRLC